jgi:hypothetical protein
MADPEGVDLTIAGCDGDSVSPDPGGLRIDASGQRKLTILEGYESCFRAPFISDRISVGISNRECAGDSATGFVD